MSDKRTDQIAEDFDQVVEDFEQLKKSLKAVSKTFKTLSDSIQLLRRSQIGVVKVPTETLPEASQAALEEKEATVTTVEEPSPEMDDDAFVKELNAICDTFEDAEEIAQDMLGEATPFDVPVNDRHMFLDALLKECHKDDAGEVSDPPSEAPAKEEPVTPPKTKKARKPRKAKKAPVAEEAAPVSEEPELTAKQFGSEVRALSQAVGGQIGSFMPGLCKKYGILTLDQVDPKDYVAFLNDMDKAVRNMK